MFETDVHLLDPFGEIVQLGVIAGGSEVATYPSSWSGPC